MIKKQLNQSEFLSALDFVKTDIDNLRAYFENGAIIPSPAVVERALKLRVSIEMFVALFGSATARDSSISDMFDNIMNQNETMVRQNADILQEVKNSGGNGMSAILNEVLNIKEMLAKSAVVSNSEPQESNEIASLKTYIANSLADLEQRIIKNVEYLNKSQLNQYSQNIANDFMHAKAGNSNLNGAIGEILGEISDFKEECFKKIDTAEGNLQEQISGAKNEIIESQKTDKYIKIAEENKVSIEKTIVFAKTNMQVLRSISSQLIGIYQSQKKMLEDIESKLESPNREYIKTEENVELAEGFAQLKEELRSISSIINYEDALKSDDPNQAIKMVDDIANAKFQPEGLLQTAKELETLAEELKWLDMEEGERE